MTTVVRLCLGLLLMAALPAGAVIETYEFSDPALEERYRDLSAELRCPKCQNQNIADSDAPIAQDLRKKLYEQLEEGSSDDEILEHMVARYGEFVRYRPRFGGTTLWLWIAPVALLAAGFLIVVTTLRSRVGKNSAGDAISAAEEARLKALLEEEDSRS